MSCKYAKYDPDDGRFSCSVSGDGCMYMIPNSKRCAVEYGEGPDADRDRGDLIRELEADQKKRESMRDIDDDDLEEFYDE